MDFNSQISRIHTLVESDKYNEALLQIKKSRFQGCDDVILILFEALCIYETGNDLETIRLLSEFLNKSKNHKKKDYALFLTAICLCNLGLKSEAEAIFLNLPDNYPEITRERNDVRKDLEIKEKAKSYVMQIPCIKNA